MCYYEQARWGSWWSILHNLYIHVVLEKARWEHSGRLAEKHLGDLLKVQESNT